MRIGIDIHTVGARETGNETYIRNLLQQMLPMANEDQFYLYHTRTLDLPAWMQRANVKRVWPHNPLVRIPFGFPLALKRDAIDVALFQYVIPPVTPCPVVTMIHDISFEFFPHFFNRLSRKRMQSLIPYAARKSRSVLTVSEFSKRQIVECYGIPDEKVTVTYNGVSEMFSVIQDETDLDRRLSRFGIHNSYILAVGNLQPRKNMERLVRVYAKLRKKGLIEQDLLLVGQMHWQGHAILAEIDRNGVGAHVKTTGYVTDDELIALYNRADLFVYPSLYEGFGLPVIESMACGTPVITSDVSSIPEVAGDAALFIDPLSDESLAETLQKLSNDKVLRDSLSKKGVIQAKKFDWRSSAEKTLSVLQGTG